MDLPRFNEIRTVVIQNEEDKLGRQGAAYRGDSEDFLTNFKAAAKEAGITPAQAAYVHLTKHYKAIGSALRTGQWNGTGDTFMDRVVDARNYLLFLLAIALEEQTLREPTNVLASATKMEY